MHDAPAFVRIDTFDCRAQRAAAARSDLYDDELAVVPAYEIDLAEPAAVPTRENFEAVALAAVDRGAMIYLLADDNFNPLQRTVLLQLLWHPE